MTSLLSSRGTSPYVWDDLDGAYSLLDEGISEAAHSTVQDAEQASRNMVRAAIACAQQ